MALQQVLAKYLPPPPPEPAPPTVMAPPAVQFTRAAGLLANLATLVNTTVTGEVQIKSQEMYNQSYGFIMYSHPLPASLPANAVLDIDAPRDRVQVFVAGQYFGAVYRTKPQPVNLTGAQPGGLLQLLVENMGRINYGHGMTDPKGL